MLLRNLAASFATIITFTLAQLAYAAPGDVLETISINNIAANAADINQQPITPHGITFGDGYMWVMDFGTDRVYRVHITATTDTSGNPIAVGDSDLNMPISELTIPQLPGGGDMPVCGAYPGDQYCGGGDLLYLNGFLWNTSPVTDNILKIDTTDGGTISASHLFTNHTYPAPSSITHDGTHFWVVDWQSNTISQVDPSTGNVLAEFDGPDNSTDPRPTGLVYDGLDFWLSYQAEERIYRIRPTSTPPLLDVLDFFTTPGIDDASPANPSGLTLPKGLAWDGEFLWHADSGTGNIYKLETDIQPFGITGCIMKNIVGVSSNILLTQSSVADKITSTDTDGCFVFPQFEPGIPIAIELNESGVSAKPFIQLNETTVGSTDVILIQNQGNYDESNYGFVATDNEDGIISGLVTASPNVIDNPNLIDVSILNETGITVEYNVIDSDGNSADPVYRTVYVLEADITPPDLTLNGSSTLTLEQNISDANLYIEPGATAIDDRDGDVTEDIVITGSVDSSIAGDYIITYTVTDLAGNTSSLTRTITVKDTTPPAITIIGSNPLDVEKGTPYIEEGAQAEDNVEGTVTLDTSHITGVVDTNTVGTYTVNYSYTDTGGNNATANRTVNVVDTGEPIITLRGSATVNHELNTPYIDAGASAADDTGEVISSDVAFTGSVDITTAGTYTLTYNISDASGNAAPTVTRDVTVADTGAPTITLLGNPVISLQKGDAYIEAGAEATDAIDDDTALTASIVITGTVDTNVNGTYTLTYDVTDSAGNPATSVTRTVNISDTGLPVISLVGNAIINLQKGDAYVEQGATATDAVDDDATLTASIVITGTVDTNTNGSYTISYNVSDSTGNAAVTVTRTINVSDTGLPVINLIGNSTINLQKGDAYVEQGATATDAVDDDTALTANIVISGTVDTNTNGSYTLSYNVSDSTGNAAITVTRTINVSDTGLPVINLIGNSTINLQKGDTYVEQGATATDAVDDDTTLTANIVITGTVDTNTNGNYTLSYNVSDSTGNAAITVTRTVNVSDTGIPVISLIGNSTINLQRGDTYVEQGATATDAVDDDTALTANIVITGTVDTTTNGAYTLSYNVSDSTGNPAITVTRTVNVADTGLPIISLIGNSTINLQKGDVYTELGATATDAVDDDSVLTANIVITGSVDTNTIGSYAIRYNVSDSTGNAAVTVTRTVNVSDTGAPAISLIGNSTINLQTGDTYNELGATATDAVDDDATLTANIVISGTVNTSVNGTYTRTYNVSDSAGNVASPVTRFIIVADTGAPVITLIGNQAINLQKGDVYTEQGAVASDAVDDNATLTANIVITGTVDTNTIGSYTLTYNVSDSTGNPAATVTRSVTISDTGSPVISLIGNQTINLQTGDTYTEQGATATDAVDDDATLTAAITITGTVDTSVNGAYTLTYNVSDSAGNPAIAIVRTVNVADTGTPVITLIGNQTINLQKGDSYVEQGATASDAVDDDVALTANIVLTGTVDTSTIGTYTRTYNVSDSSGNAALPVTRTINISDTGIPVITLNGNSVINHEQGTIYTDLGATALDSVDGDMGTFFAPETVDTATAGTYTLNYNISDAAGNAAITVTRDVIVADTISPVITRTGSATINHEQGDVYTDEGATATDTLDGSVSVTVSGAVDTSTEGTYTLSYNAVDAAGNNATTITRDVIVADTIIPVITLLGLAELDHPSGGSPYEDPGVVAIDNLDGDITLNVNTGFVVSGDQYLLSYDVDDAAGNAAATINRIVNVVTPVAIAIEAETATIGGSHIVSSTNAGFTGSGYIEHSGEGYIEYTFTSYGVPYDLTVRYAQDTGDRPLEVILNSVSLGNLAFPASGSFTTWVDTATFTFTPLSGSNTIRFQTTGTSGANIDQLTLTPQ